LRIKQRSLASNILSLLAGIPVKEQGWPMYSYREALSVALLHGSLLVKDLLRDLKSMTIMTGD
jgi:anti-sigma factor RsiW